MRRFNNLDFTLRQLQYAVAVADTGGFGSAATACGVSQPSLSAQVAKLEHALGLQLFERHARATHITGAGRELLPRMRVALQAGQAVQQRAGLLVDPYGVTLKIGVIPTVAPYLLPRVVELLMARTQAPRVHWLELQTNVCEQALEAGEIDAMIIADSPSRPSFEHVDLGWEAFWVLVSEGDALRGPVDLADVAERELLLLEHGHCLRDHTMALCMQPGARESAYRATSLATLVQMVASGLGTSVIPASAIAVEVGRAKVRAEPFATTDVGRTLRLAWRSRTAHGLLLGELADLLRRGLADSTPG